MGKGSALRWLENRILRRHIRGCGVEIGALWRRFPVPVDARVWYLDRQSTNELRHDYADVETIVRPDVVADAVDLPFVPLGLNFIIASHVLEHLPFPLVALRCWYDALSSSGVLLLKIPDKRFTFDLPRRRTTLDHLLLETDHPGNYDNWSHHADWVEHILHAKPSEPHFDSAVQDLIDSGFSIHYHVWIDEDVRAIIDYTISNWKLSWRPIVFWRAHFYRKEAIVMLKKFA
jgi:SAM-dependent methyltransferase